jgi:hypothetical protein
MGAIGVWTVFALCAIAFQCPLPDSWLYRPDRCTAKVSTDLIGSPQQRARLIMPGSLDVPNLCHEHPDRRGRPHPSLLHDAQGPDDSRKESKDPVCILRKSTVGRPAL